MTPLESSLRVNGHTIEFGGVPGDERLLDTVRWRLGLKGTKEGCRTGECGACTVLIDGRSHLSCLELTRELAGSEVTTIETVGASPAGRQVEAAFAAEGALQCGYCTPGFVVALTGLLTERAEPPPAETLLAELGTHLCRCTGYAAISRAVERVRREAP